MSNFIFEEKDSIGKVIAVDTSSVVIEVQDLDKLKSVQVNQLSIVQSPKAGQNLIGLIKKIKRKPIDQIEESTEQNESTENLVRVTLIGTLLDKFGKKENVFKRTLETVPEIDANCYILSGADLTKFMETIAVNSTDDEIPLSLGNYTLDTNAKAYIDGDKLFQRHACIVGSTGSGKSWCVAKLVEQIAELKNANSILLDIHGEYSPLESDKIANLKIVGPGDVGKKDLLSKGLIKLPYWLLTYEEMLSMCLDRSDNNAPNQAMLFAKIVAKKKLEYLEANDLQEYIPNFTVDSPIPYDIKSVVEELQTLDIEKVPGARAGSDKAGPFNGKLTRFIQRLDAKFNDRRLSFLFEQSDEEMKFEWLDGFISLLMNSSSNNSGKGVKIINLSEVPSDILPLITGLIARLLFTVQQWTDIDERQPISIFCDEAHLYIPQNNNNSELGLKSFERIAKEGRKYGTGLVIISQRPSEVNRTVLSQCSNFISLRLSNQEDQSVIKKLLPDSLGDLTDLLPVLDIGEALIVGDCTLLPIRISIDEPKNKPSSATVEFWTEWSKKDMSSGLNKSVEYMRKQSKPSS